jgi:hypothetical protein
MRPAAAVYPEVIARGRKSAPDNRLDGSPRIRRRAATLLRLCCGMVNFAAMTTR